MRHSPEPWRVKRGGQTIYPADVWIEKDDDHQIAEMSASYDCGADADRIVACVNGCAGLNPAAYGECTEAMQDAISVLQHVAPSQDCTDLIALLTSALAHAQAQP